MPEDVLPNLTTRILVEIRDELRKTTAELRTTNERVDGLTGEVRKTNERLDALTFEVKKTNARVDHLAERVDLMSRELPGLIVDREDRVSTMIESWLHREGLEDKAWRQDVDKRLNVLEKKTG